MLVDLKQIMAPTDKYGYAVPAFNTGSSELLRGILEASIEKDAPVIVEVHPDELAFAGDSFIKLIREEAIKAPIPVCIHLDHGASFEQVMHAISCGYTSAMIDASSVSFEDNIAITSKVVEAAHAAGISVEAEIGTIGASCGAAGVASTDNIIYTDPTDAKVFVERTGIDALAVAIGTAHGLYPKGLTPHLKLDLLKQIHDVVPVPLVLHGGSDNPDEEIHQAVKLGVGKINISSDIKVAFFNKCREVLTDKSLREPGAIYPEAIEALKVVAKHKIDLFDCAGAAKYYR